MIPLIEKGLAFESVYVDLHKFEQHPTGSWRSIPRARCRCSTMTARSSPTPPSSTNTSRTPSPTLPPLRPRDAGRRGADALLEQVRRRAGDELRLDARLAPHGRRDRAQDREGEFEQLLEHIPLPDQRKKWATARSGFSEADLANASEKIEYALDKVEKQLGETRVAGGRWATRSPTSTSIRIAG